MVIPRDAASVIIIRNAPEGGRVEVLMVRRTARASFVPNVYVFPGGSIDKEDCSHQMKRYCKGLDLNKLSHLIPDLKPPEKVMGAYVAVLRETFEEVGILVAYEEHGRLISLNTPEKRVRFMNYRRALNEGKIKFSEILERERLTLAMERLYYFSHWITPELSPIRFSVRFFVTEAPGFQEGSHDGQELTDHRWIAPGEALRLNGEGSFDMVLPTIVNLTELEKFKTAEEVIESTRKKRVLSVLSKLKIIDGRYVEVLPENME